MREFRELRRAAESGYQSPPEKSSYKPPDFEVDARAARRIPLGPYTLRVTPVSRLRVVMVQTGYRRLHGKTPVSCAYHRLTDIWYPGVELFGEGLLLDLDTRYR